MPMFENWKPARAKWLYRTVRVKSIYGPVPIVVRTLLIACFAAILRRERMSLKSHGVAYHVFLSQSFIIAIIKDCSSNSAPTYTDILILFVILHIVAWHVVCAKSYGFCLNVAS